MMVQPRVPKYNPQAARTVLEASVAALAKSQWNEWIRQKEEEEERTKNPAEAMDVTNHPAYNAANPRPAPLILSSNVRRNGSLSSLSSSSNDANLECGESLGRWEAVIGKRVAKCVIHGEGCDGVAVSGALQTQSVLEGRGLWESVPMLIRSGGGRWWIGQRCLGRRGGHRGNRLSKRVDMSGA